MTRVGKNIYATHLPYVTVVPILQMWICKTPMNRGITFSTGAADAYGR
jgi:hypothetical protein